MPTRCWKQEQDLGCVLLDLEQDAALYDFIDAWYFSHNPEALPFIDCN